MAMLSTPVNTGALIAEFGGKLYVSTRHATAVTENVVQDHGIRVDVVDRRARITCECGVVAEWSAPRRQSGEWNVFRLFYGDAETDPYGPLTIIRAVNDTPPCDHWSEVPLKLAVEP